jgi:hypothetical protein
MILTFYKNMLYWVWNRISFYLTPSQIYGYLMCQ